ncbi:hypothetical protein I5466_02860 [Citrobacter koseri]|uniref:hypothetical protein n=1 Tax=Citrobacter koseri TaxID=545 RepID=UPI00190582AD|nr:hypothetical protein [Citrobacter koseri]MBJ9119747.1 hypothetical protein [Citrobacter koseri]MBJ9243875.1 hypothetical protein [Citrobacter koseri]
MKTIQLSERELSIVYSLMAPPYRAEDIRSDEFNELRNKVFYALRDAQNDEPVSDAYKLPPHVYRELVNQLHSTAMKYGGCQQLREQISRTLDTVLGPAHSHIK